ncbi:two-component sensor histidine kinase [Streptomyces sp. NBRC 14336]|uniref:sensor histidine kinase n=1 Tax=Streptomyces sp. NBRC 14336 TaxID=3030992 RepID=UPI0024A213B3|nr:sensor histidine kinase [Streptomyces sp. NBRC 14336]WBO79267.1 sensor histidine kinase [Streptomyces sp. SBE_14.2]GLW50592.1 two-component sensor histidine kinase [Streptomyces sp. NBRC 14336]
MTTSLERYTERVEQYASRFPRFPRFLDVMMVLALIGCASLGTQLSLPGVTRPNTTESLEVMLGLSCFVLLKYRTHTRTVVVVVAGVTIAAIARGYLLTPLLLAPLLAAMYWLAVLCDRRTVRWYALVVTVALLTVNLFSDGMRDLSPVLTVIGPVFWMALPLVGGSLARLRGDYLEAVKARAEHAERTREEEARLRVAEERMRIARELHDVVAHHLALANAQAGTAAHLARSNPEQSRKILDDLTGTTSSALRELKATLGLLRQDDRPDGEGLEPAPGLARLPELVDSYRSAGLEVTVHQEGAPRPLSPGVDLTAYRIVQEALTNVAKHASAHAAHVTFTYADSRLLITVSNDGPAPAPAPATASGGFGLRGMRERAQSIGGDLCAGPRPEGGFEVTTALPLQPSAAVQGETV